MHSTTTPSTNERAVSRRRPGLEGWSGASESDQTKPSARMAVDRASRVGKNRTNEAKASAPKRRKRANEANFAPSRPITSRENRQRWKIPTRVRLDVCIRLVDFPPAFGAAPCGRRSAQFLVRSSVASQPPRSSERHGRAGHPTCGLRSWSVNYRVRRSLSRACRQRGTGGSRDLALSFSICAISSSNVAHPCRYRQSISKVRSVGLPPVHRWINRQAMIAQ